MALPVVNNPTYEIKLHSVEKPIKYRPFLVKEEKILLTALEGGETADIVRATKEIIGNCCLDKRKDQFHENKEYFFPKLIRYSFHNPLKN